MRRLPSKAVPVDVVVDLVCKISDEHRDAVRSEISVPMQRLGYPHDAEHLSLRDALELLEMLDAGIIRPARPRHRRDP